MMKKLRHYLLAGIIMLLWSHTLYAQTGPPNNGSPDCGRTLNFDGVSEYVAIPYSAETNTASTSVSFWVYVKGFTGTYQGIVTSRNDGPLRGWTLYVTPENKFSLLAGIEGSSWGGITTTNDVQLNTWTHVAFTLSGTAATLYVNGTSITETFNYNYVPNEGAEMRIGAGVTEQPAANYFLHGQVAEFTLWNRALSSKEIASLRAGIDIGSTNLVAYYDFNAEPGSTTLSDRTGNGHTGTLENMESSEDWVALIRSWYADLDADGYAGTPIQSCGSPGEGYSASLGELLPGDCDDDDGTVQGAVFWYADLDSDGYAGVPVESCTSPGPAYGPGLGDLLAGDCDDTRASVNPGGTEVPGNGLDDDCNPATFDIRPFVTIWKTDDQITIPTTGSGYDYTVYWENTADPSINGTATGLVGDATITFPEAGTYRVEIAGDFPRIYFSGDDDQKIISIAQWGDIAWTSMAYAFQGCSNLTSTATDAPDLSGVDDMSFMFENASAFNSDLSGWDVSGVKNMAYMFAGAQKFNGDLGSWDVSSVTSMNAMFQYAYAFNGDLGDWDLSSITSMSWMFNQSGMSVASYDAALAGWSTLSDSETRIPAGIYFGATGLKYCDAASRHVLAANYGWLISGDTDISGNSGEPVVEKLPTIISQEPVTSLQAPVAVTCAGDTLTAVANVAFPVTATTTIIWTYADDNEATIDITQQQHVFVGRPFVFTWEGEEVELNGDWNYDYSYVVDWGDGTVDTLQSNAPAHRYATKGPHTISVYGQFPGLQLGDDDGLRSIEQWGDIAWRTMRYMFAYTSPVFNATDAPDLSQVTDMSHMFQYTAEFNGDLSSWDVSNVTNMRQMFYNATAFNGDLSGWDVSNVTNMRQMFFNATAFNGDLSGWDISSVTDMSFMLSRSGLSAANYDATLAGWATLNENEAKVPAGIQLAADELFYCSTAGRASLTTDFGWTINGDSDASTLSGIPRHKQLPVVVSEGPVTGLEAPVATNCAGDILTAVTDAALPITASTAITWTYTDEDDATEDVTQQQYIFVGQPFVFTWGGDYAYLDGDSDYEYSYIIDWGDGAIDTLQSHQPEHTYATEGPHTISVYGQFPGIRLGEERGLRSIEQWGDIAWRTMRYMFAYTSPVFNATDAPDLSQVTNMSYMFNYAGFNGDISNWDVSNVTDMSYMFRHAAEFNGDLSNWDVSNVTNMFYMFRNATAFNGDLSNWDVSSVTNMSDMLSYSGMSAANYDATLAGWATLDENETKIPVSVDLGVDGLHYCNAANRNILATDYDWSISGDTDISGTSGDPVVKRLPPVASSEPVTDLAAPIAITCAGDTLTAVTDATLPITATTVITWTYVDDNEATGDITQQQHVFTGRPFVFTGKTHDIGPGPGHWIIVQPHVDFTAQTNVMIDWGDGTTSHYDGSNPYTGYPFDLHNYAQPGVYTISIYGDLPGITTDFFMGEDELAPYLQSVEQWGDIAWKTMDGAFEGAVSLQINATDVPNLDNVTSTHAMFRDATHFTADLGAWDVSNLTDMTGMFSNSGMSVRHYDATLKGWATLGENETDVPAGITLGAKEIRYCDATGRDILVNDYGWHITDAGSYCPQPPVLAVPEDKVVTEGETLSFMVEATAGDLSFLYGLDAASLAKGMTLDPATGGFSWTPAPAQVGEHSVVLTLDDAQSPVVSDTFTITVNDALLISSNAGLTLKQGEAAAITSALLSVSDNDKTPASLVYTVTASPANGTLKKGEAALDEHSTFTQADIDNGLIRYAHDGFNGVTDEFSFTVTNGNTTLTSTFEININIVLAVDEGSIDEMTLYPVPAGDVVTLRMTNAYRGEVSVRFFDANGRKMVTVDTVKDRAEFIYPINIASIPSGVLVVYVKTGDRTRFLWMIKK